MMKLYHLLCSLNMKKTIITILVSVGVTLLYGRLQTNNFIPKYTTNSFIEWLDNKLQPSANIVTSLTITEEIRGKVQRVGYAKGQIGGLKYYYTGTPGFYNYDSFITLDVNGRVIPVYFSPERTRQMKVFLNGKQIPFTSILPNDHITLTEVIDVKRNNINDENLVKIQIEVERE